jgi:hypothetical protein
LVCVATCGNLSLFAKIYVGIEKRSMHCGEVIYREQNSTMYSDSKNKRKKTNTVKSLCEKA